MTSVTHLFVIRHGETLWNTEEKMQGHLDSPLTEKGLSQIQSLAETLQFYQFVAIYTSDLPRAYHTAQRIAEKHQQPVLTDYRLREKNLGIFQGLSRQEILLKYPEEYQQYQLNTVNYAVPQGESTQQFFDRCVGCFEELVYKHNGERILVVTHGGVLGCLFRHVVSIPLNTPRHFSIHNTSINTFSHHIERGWSLQSWGNISHLDSHQVCKT